MNAIVRQVLEGDVIGPDETVAVYGTTHPLNAVAGARISRRVPAGLSIAEILAVVLAGRAAPDLIVRLGDHEIPRENWRAVRLKPGAVLTFTPRLGDTPLLRTVLTVVVAIAAFAFAGPIAASLTIAGFAITGTALAIATAVISAGIMLAGTLAINALLPIRPPAQPDSVNSATLNSIQGAQNQSAPFQPIPVVLGRHRQSPFYAAKPFTELVGDDQYLRLLFCLGYGPLLIEDLRIGDTPIGEYVGLDVEIRQGFPTDGPVNFPSQVDELALSIDLNESRGLNIQTTPDDIDEISVDVTAQEGVFRVNTANGKFEPYSVTVDALYRRAGSGDGWTSFGPVYFGMSRKAQRLGLRVVVPRGQYEVALQKKGFADDDNVKDGAIWTALRSVRYAPPVSFSQPLALVYMRIKATGQLSGIVSTFNCVTTSLVNAWNGAAWQQNTASQNPADLYRHVLQGAANARPRSEAQVDLANLQQWSAFCVANGFRFNQVVTGVGSVYDKLCDIAAAGRAKPTFSNGLWGVDWDRPNDPIVQHFTPANSWGFKLQRPYVQQPHGWRASFINEENGFTQDERIVYDDGYDVSNASLFEAVQFPGVTDPDLIWKHGRFHIAQSRLRPEKISLNVGWEHLVCTRGDRVKVTHDAILIGLGAGRVKSVDGQVVTLDQDLVIEPDKSYGIEFRVPDDVRSFERAIDAVMGAGEYPKGTEITLVGDLDLVRRGALFAFGETEQESAIYRVQAIAHQQDLVAILTLVDDALEISQADQGAIPAYDPHVTVPPDPLTLAPQDFRYLEATDGEGNSVRAITRLSWTASRRGIIAASELQYADGDGAWQPLAVLPYPQFSLDVPLPAPGVWSYRVRFQFDDNTVSKWVSLDKLTLLGLSAAPPDVQNIRGVAYVDDTTSIAWDEVLDYRPVRYAVRKGDSWDAALELGTIAHPPFAAHGNGTYLVKAYVGPDANRTYSVTAASVEIAGASLVKNVIAIRDEKANGWDGVFTGTVARSGATIRTGGSADLLTDPDFLNDPDILNRGGQGDGTYEISPARYIDARRATACRVTITWKATGQVVTDNMLSNPDILANPDFLAAGSTDLIEVYPEISVAQNDLVGDVFSLDPVDNPANDIFAEADVFSADVSFSPWIKYEPGMYVGRYYRGRLVFKVHDPQVVAIALEFSMTVDVPDRVDIWGLVAGVGASLNQITVPAVGLAIVFASNGKTIAEPFNGGPGADAVPLIQITNTSASAFDFEVTGLTLSGCTIIPRLAGTPTDAPKTNVTIQGW